MRKSRFAELRGFRMLKLWEDFLNQPSVFISLCALVISFLALSLQFVSFKLNGSRIKVNLSLTFYEPTTGVFFNYPISSTRKNVLSDPVTQKFRTGNIRKEFNNAGGIELLKVTISNHGRFPASIKDISFGYGVHGKEYQHYFSKYTIGLPPYFFPLIKQFRLSLIKSREEMNSSCITITGTPFTIYKTLPITKNPASHYMHM